MEAERWQKIKGLFDAALELAPAKREKFLNNACGADAELRREVENLLASSDNVGSFMKQAAIGEVAEILVSEDKNLQIGERLSHFKIIEPLDAGGMGKIYLAEDLRLHRRVALKVLPDDIAADKDYLRRFEQEALAASALNHPNILTIYEIVETNDSRFIASEYIKGETLRRTIQNLSVSDTLDIAVQIAAALDAAHRSGIIHRDIKPENIMRREDGLIKVLDFGLAKLLEKQTENLDTEATTRALVQTEPGLIMGTAAYMSPEQARGKAVDARTDIFSFGVVMYEMLSGKLPFAGDSSNDVIAAILKTEPAPLARYDVPKDLAHIVSKALRKNADERYQHIKDLLIDLKDFKQDSEFEAKLKRNAAPSKNESKAAGKPHAFTKTQNARTTLSTEYIAGEIRNNKLGFGILSVLILAAIGFGYWFFASRSTNIAPIESIAVMPFVNESGNADTEYLSDGMTESLISSLSQLPKLAVKARSSVFRYKGKDVKPQTIGNALSVQAVLLGRIVQHNDMLTLSLELVDAQTENVIWSEQYNRQQTDLVWLQSEIARDVSQKLRLRLSGAEERRVAKNYTTNTEAYQLYLKGRFYWNKRTGEGLKKSVEYFNQAIEQDQNYALAFAGLAESYVIFSGFAVSTPQEAYPKAKAAAKKALELDETLAEAHAALGLELLAYEWNAAESSREFQRAIELNPNYATARHWYGNQNLLYTGRFEEAIVEMRRAQELDPLSLVINTDLGDTYFYARQYDKAIEQLRKTIEMDQSFYYAHYELGMALEMKGAYAEAIAQYQRARGLNNDPRVPALLGHALAASGRRDEALKTLSELKEIAKQQYVPAYNFAIVYAGLKDPDQAFEWLEKSYQDRSSRMTILQVDPFLDNLRSDPRLADLISRVGLLK